jgi:hypothetical protein
MKTVVWKYQLSYREGRQDIDMPLGAKILSVQPQYDGICIWALVNPDQTEMDTVRFNKVYTGAPVPRNVGEYVATCQVQRGENRSWLTVVHVFRARTVKTFAGDIKEV